MLSFRATILRGQYTHNHEILSNDPPRGASRSSATWATRTRRWPRVKEQGYRTALLREVSQRLQRDLHSSGWDEWYAVTGNYLSTFNENGHLVSYEPESYYDTDVMSDKASDYITRTAGPTRRSLRTGPS